jgi:hypothetical protein
MVNLASWPAAGLSLFCSVSLASLAAPASAGLVYSNNFDAPPVLAPGVSASGFTNGFLETALSFGSWTGSYFVNRSTGNPSATSALTLSNLPPHTQINVSFVLGFLESWDSNNGPCCSPDLLKIDIDGSPVLAGLTSNNASGTNVIFGGGSLLHAGVQANTVYGWTDTLVDMSTSSALTFPHTASTLTLALTAYGAGWQGGYDEAWGLDDLSITYTPVPGPLPWLGVASALHHSRRTRRRLALRDRLSAPRPVTP